MYQSVRICAMTNLRQLAPDEYPLLLREIPDLPKQLYIQGEMPGPDTKLLTVVGSRKQTSYGKDVIDFLIGGLKGYDVSIVSGLALGTDGHAHKAAMKNGLHTIAVPGSGIDMNVIYPRSHLGLAKEILASGGLLLSELEPTTGAAPWTFPQRNRIMAGMAHATLIIEATERSGTLITARLATEYNRDLLVVPGSIFADSTKGCHQFLKLGATPVTTPSDILRALDIVEYESEPTKLNLSQEEQLIYDALAAPTTRDELLQQLALPTTQANILLSKMELDEVIVERMGELRRA